VKASQLADLVSGKLHGTDVEFQGFSTDSRHIKPGQLYIARIGEALDGHQFLADVHKKGATAALVQTKQNIDIPQIVVPNTDKAFATWAAWHRSQFPDIKVIAVTGSCGKTTTKQMMSAIFSKAGPTLAAEGSFNNHVGVPMTLLGLTAAHRYAVIEMGANHPHEISPLTHMAKPDVAMITIVAPVHTEGFGDVDTIAKTKAEIFEGLDKNGVAIVNHDDHYYDFWKQLLKNQPTLSFSTHDNKADIFASDIKLEYGCAAFLLNTPKGTIQIQLPILGRHNVINALAAASAAIALNIPLDLIAQGLAHMQPAKHRLHVCKGINGATIIDDAYNANPLAVKAALDILADYPGEKVWVFFDMKELGALAHEEHAAVGRKARENGVARIFALGEHAKITVDAFGDGAEHFVNKADLINALKPHLHKNMTILIKGSRSGALEEVVKALTE
jgi:UDP-N-acetylmuramoyl-tripeptide--D-alanyl-D-alanine ligase